MSRKNESGYTLVGVLAIFTIIAILGISLIMLSLSSVKTSNVAHDDQSVYYIAEAGANIQKKKIEQLVHKIYIDKDVHKAEDFYEQLATQLPITDDEATRYDNFEKTKGQQPVASMTVQEIEDSEPGTYKIVSVGMIENQIRTVEQAVHIKWPEGDEDNNDGSDSGKAPPFAVFATGDRLKLQDDIQITGNIGVGQAKNGGIDIQGNDIDLNGDIYIPKSNKDIIENRNTVEKRIKGDIIEYEESQPLPPLPPFPAFDKVPSADSIDYQDGGEYTLTLMKDSFYKKIELQDTTLNIDTKNQDRKITVDKIDLQNAHINIIGTGRLTLYMDGHLELENGSTLNGEGNIDQLNIYSRGKADFQDQSMIRGSLYLQDGHLELEDASELYGNVFIAKGKLDMQGGSSLHSEIVLVPNHKIEIDKSHVKGPVYGERFDMQGGSLDHRPPFQLEGPLSFGALDFAWPDLGQGNVEEDEEDDTPKPDLKPTITSNPVKEVENKR